MTETARKSSRKAIFLDIDGTLTTFGGILPKSAGKALEQAQQNGHELIICTGRTMSQIYPWIRESHLFSGIISGTGADVRMHHKVIYQHFIDASHLTELLDYLYSIRVFFFLQCASGVYTQKEAIYSDEELFAGDPVRLKERERRIGKISVIDDAYRYTDVEKIYYHQSEADIDTMRKRLGDYFYVMTSSYGKDHASDGEITCTGIDKAAGMQKYLDAAGIRREDSIAFGDGPNDFEMLDYAGTSVCMGNGLEELKERADHVIHDIDDDGLYRGFMDLGLI